MFSGQAALACSSFSPFQNARGNLRMVSNLVGMTLRAGGREMLFESTIYSTAPCTLVQIPFSSLNMWRCKVGQGFQICCFAEFRAVHLWSFVIVIKTSVCSTVRPDIKPHSSLWRQMHIFSLIQPEFLYSCRLVIVKLVKDVELMFNLLLWNFFLLIFKLSKSAASFDPFD